MLVFDIYWSYIRENLGHYLWVGASNANQCSTPDETCQLMAYRRQGAVVHIGTYIKES
jgi:hypothetical protein